MSIAVQPFKSGPDYIDPAFHFAAARRASFNIDSWSMSAELIDAISHQASGAELIIAEGSMGLFDGVATRGAEGYGSSAETAQRLGWPVVLVIDVSGQAQSAAATALGFKTYAPDLNIEGVILNRVDSPRHVRLARLGMQKAGIEVFGSLPRRGDLALPERHLGGGVPSSTEFSSSSSSSSLKRVRQREGKEEISLSSSSPLGREGKDPKSLSIPINFV